MSENSAIERAYDLARSGNYSGFTEVKRALRREFKVERELVGPTLARSITALCRRSRPPRREQTDGPTQASL